MLIESELPFRLSGKTFQLLLNNFLCHDFSIQKFVHTMEVSLYMFYPTMRYFEIPRQSGSVSGKPPRKTHSGNDANITFLLNLLLMMLIKKSPVTFIELNGIPFLAFILVLNLYGWLFLTDFWSYLVSGLPG